MVVEVIDAPWAMVPARIRWHQRCWLCRERTCQTVTFLEHSEKVCAPRVRLRGAGDPQGVRVLGVDEHVWHHQDRRR